MGGARSEEGDSRHAWLSKSCKRSLPRHAARRIGTAPRRGGCAVHDARYTQRLPPSRPASAAGGVAVRSPRAPVLVTPDTPARGVTESDTVTRHSSAGRASGSRSGRLRLTAVTRHVTRRGVPAVTGQPQGTAVSGQAAQAVFAAFLRLPALYLCARLALGWSRRATWGCRADPCSQ